MKYLKTKNAFKGNNLYFDCNTQEGFSYHWWKFSSLYKGHLIFNNTFYSVVSCLHQKKVKRLLSQPIYIELKHQVISLDTIGVENALRDEIVALNNQITFLLEDCHRKFIRPPTIEKNYKLVEKIRGEISKIEALLAL
jgi:hypothetical protein